MKLGTEVDRGSGYIVLDGDPGPSPRKWAQQPFAFRRTLLWHGRPSPLLLSTCLQGCAVNETSNRGCRKKRTIHQRESER